MNKLPAWIPNFNAWMSALLLLILVRGMKYLLRIILAHTDYRFWEMFAWNDRAVAYLLILLSPIVIIAIAHHLLHIFLDLFLPDSQTSEMAGKKLWFPGLMSWWEGLYGWLAIALTAIVSTAIGIIIFSPSYYLSEINSWWLGIQNWLSPFLLIRLICVAYLYQFEQLVSQHLIAVGRES